MDSWTVSGGDNTDIRVDATGPADARRVVFLHGYSQSRLSWREQFDSRLAESYRLVAPDLRGHGRSGKPEDAYDESALWAADLAAVFDSAGADAPVVVAWSYGGLALLDYLAERGTDRVAGINLVGAVSAIGTESATERLGSEYIALMDGLTDTDAERSIEAIEGLVRVCQAEPPSERELALMAGYNALCPPRVRDALRSRTVDHEALATSVDLPVLVTHGADDRVVDPATGELHAENPRAQHSVYRGVGHSPFLERPERFTRELLAFLDDL
ncbi:alpha/beta fold hydrolase [Halosegnis longus]|uniref:alpha/beta fold hydrolase n=1 Tax=Halosegnis longus TaxID=2216012 RepID=UPI00096A327C|nr:MULTISPECIES: alpha/beta hydrolase [Halobacteriales]